MTSKKRRKAREWMRAEREKNHAELTRGIERAYSEARLMAERHIETSAEIRRGVTRDTAFVGRDPFEGRDQWVVRVPIRFSDRMRLPPTYQMHEMVFQKVAMGYSAFDTSIRWFNIVPRDECRPVAFGLDGLTEALDRFLYGAGYMTGFRYDGMSSLKRFAEDTRISPALHEAQYAAKMIVIMKERLDASLLRGSWDPQNIRPSKEVRA